MIEDYIEKTKWNEIIEIPNRGVFRVKYSKLSIRSIKNLITRKERELWKLRGDVTKLQETMQSKQNAIKNIENFLNTWTVDILSKYVELEQQRQIERDLSARKFLENFIGTERYAELERKGFYKFQGLDGKTYRIKQNGQLQSAEGKYWYNRCVIRKHGLPLPDFIAAVITATKNDYRFLMNSRKSQTNEQVGE